MPDFDVQVVDGAETAAWFDLPTADEPSRLNPAGTRSPMYWRVAPGATVTLEAVVDGVQAPMDDEVGGRPFLCSWAEWGGRWAPRFTLGANQSSHVEITFAAGTANLGHHVFVFWRPEGGAVAVHLDVEPALGPEDPLEGGA